MGWKESPTLQSKRKSHDIFDEQNNFTGFVTEIY